MGWLLVTALGVLALAPLAGLLTQFSGAAFLEMLRDASFQKSLTVTLISALVAAVASTLLALFFARQFAYQNWSGKRLQRLMLLLPYLMPNFVLAMTYVTAWNPVTGLLNGYCRFPGGLYGMNGMTILFTITHMPVAFLLTEEKLRRIDSSLQEAATLSGASRWQTFVRIELPLLLPNIVTSLGLCFALNISAFAIPAWIGAPAHIYPLTYKIYQAIQLGGLEGVSDAANIAVVLFIFAMVPFFIGYLIQGNDKKYVLLSGKSPKARTEGQSVATFVVFQSFFFLSQILFWVAPLLCLFLSTLVPPGCLQNQGVSCLKTLSFSHYRYVLFNLEETRFALRASLLYGSLSAALIILISIFMLMAFANRKLAVKVIESIYTIPLSTPGAIIALGLIVVYSGRFGVNLYNTPWIVVIAFVIKHLSLAFSPLRTGVNNISPSLIEAAKLSGARRSQIWKRIILPVLQPECLGGFFLVFVPIIGELTMSVFLSSPSFRSIGTVLFDLQDYADQASASSLALLLVMMILIFNECSRLLSRGKLGY